MVVWRVVGEEGCRKGEMSIVGKVGVGVMVVGGGAGWRGCRRRIDASHQLREGVPKALGSKIQDCCWFKCKLAMGMRLRR